MAKGTDLRVQKTYSALITAFCSLLEEKRFEDITVNELCENALVRRATFYKHFSDKYDFFAFMIRRFQGELMQEHAAEESEDAGFYFFVISSTFDFLDENRRLVNSLLKSTALPLLIDILTEQIYEDVREHMERGQAAGHELPSSPDVLARGFAGALVTIARWWVTEGTALSKEEVVEECGKVLQPFL